METHQTVHGGVDLLIDAAALLLAGRDRVVDQTLVCGFVRRREDEGRIRRRILCAALSLGGCNLSART